jgi:O-antigen ligase
MTVAGRTFLAHPASPRTGEAWLAAGLVAAVVCAVAALFGHPAVMACAAVAGIAAALAFYEPRLIGPLLALALPLEISKLWFPFLQTRAELGGGLPPTSVVDAGRLVIALAFAVWLLRPQRARADVIPASPLTLPLALLFAVYALSTLYALDVSAARTETLRLLFSLGGFALVPFFVRDRASLRWTLFAFVAAAAALALVGVYQQLSGHFFWNDGLGRFGERRVNTTFADPNHFARYLVEAIVVAIMLWPFSIYRARLLLLAAIGACLLTLAFTGSRGAWIVGAAVVPVAVWSLPVTRAARLRILVGGAGAIVALALAVAAFSPFFTKRVDTFTFGVEASGARPYLVDAGMHMFADHPITGVGAGGYQSAFLDDYYSFKDPKIKANVTISHTSAVTLLAELGLIGVAAVLFVIARWAAYLRTLMARFAPGDSRAALKAVALISVIILLGSQTEGRFLEDPYLWFVAGLAVAIDQIGAAERTASAREAPAHEHADARP